MKKRISVFLLIASLMLPASARAATQDVLITALQTESATSASEEFITVTNNSGSVVDISTWHLQYFSATAANFSTPTRNIALNGSLAAHASYMAASTGYKTDVAKVFFGATITVAGGHVRLVSGNGASEVQHDLLGWGTALHPEVAAVAAAAKGVPYLRITGSDGLFVDTDNNAHDFTNGTTPAVTPVGPSDPQTPATPEPTPQPQPEPDSPLEEPSITELLPDPAAPATDATGEFVELHNPNLKSIDLTGYKLQTGASNSYTYTFKSGSLGPNEYKAYYAPDTKLTLSNSGGKARLLNASGEVVSETAAYGKAPTGSAWMLFGDMWQWSAAPSPNAANSAAAQVAGAVTAGTSGGATTAAKSAKTTTAAKAKTTAAAAKKTTAVKTTKTAAAAGGDYKNPASNNQTLPLSPLLLAVVGVPLIGYMLYEYRHDLANYYAKLRRHRSRRRATGTTPAGR